MPAIWSGMSSNGHSESLILDPDLPVPIDIRPMRNARRLRLRYDEVSGRLKLTCPARTSRRSALAWALEQRKWIEAQLARAQPAEPFVPGAWVPIDGVETLLMWSAEWPRSPSLLGEELRCGGPLDGMARRVELFLKRRALEVMSREVSEFARAAGVSVRSVAVGDAGSRWGSCSSQGRIRLSWRLILAPPQARRYVVAHEVAHLRHLDHSAEFKAFEARLFGPGVAEAKAILRRVGPRLRGIGRR
ncbi:MAG: M48 family metallopeptidase [Sphingomicrobium sp.]